MRFMMTDILNVELLLTITKDFDSVFGKTEYNNYED